MTWQTYALTPAARSSANLLIWWQTLSDDEQDLLRVTYSLLPGEPYLLALLASSKCPLVIDTGDITRPFELLQPHQLHVLFQQL
jgi:phosphoglycolate phosphatase-like HAD superfamily hydrolase